MDQSLSVLDALIVKSKDPVEKRIVQASASLIRYIRGDEMFTLEQIIELNAKDLRSDLKNKKWKWLKFLKNLLTPNP